MSSSNMSYNSRESEEEEEFSDEEAENSYTKKVGGKAGIIFLIDGRKNMIERNDDQEGNDFIKSVKCCEKTMRNGIMTNDSEHIGVILFGTRTDSNGSKNIKTLVPLDKPSSMSIKKLRDIIKFSVEKYKEDIGISEEYSIGNALWFCSSVFSTSNVKYRNRTIFLLTNDFNPHDGDQGAQQLARTKAKDLVDIGIKLHLLHIGRDFDVSVFYKEILEMNEYPIISSQPVENYEDLVGQVKRRTSKNRCIGNLLLDLGHGTKIGVSCYNLFRKAKIPVSEKLCRVTNEPLKSVTQFIHSETGSLLLPTDMVYTMQISGEKITFTPEEKKTLNYMSEPGITVLGFKPSSSIKIEEQCKPASFIYPNEDVVLGSRKLFVTMLDLCLEMDKVAVCKITSSHSRHPYTVFLKPQKEILDDAGNQTCPGGFHVIYIPFKDSVRNIPEEADESVPEVTDNQVAKAKSVIKKLRFKYQPEVFKNPKLETHWANIEALALEDDEPQNVIDSTVPDLDYMTERLGTLSVEFTKSVYPDDYKPELTTARKRSADPSAGTSKAKLPRVETPYDIEKLIREKKVHTLTVIKLKEYLISKFPNIKTNGLKKATLVELVYNPQ